MSLELHATDQDNGSPKRVRTGLTSAQIQGQAGNWVGLVDPLTGKFDPSLIPVSSEVSGGKLITDNYTVTQAIIDAKYVYLSYKPEDPRKVELNIYGGIEQRAHVDFFVEENVLSWDSLSLQLLLELDDSFSVRYVPEIPQP